MSARKTFFCSLVVWEYLLCLHLWRIVLLGVEFLVHRYLSTFWICHSPALCPPLFQNWFTCVIFIFLLKFLNSFYRCCHTLLKFLNIVSCISLNTFIRAALKTYSHKPNILETHRDSFSWLLLFSEYGHTFLLLYLFYNFFVENWIFYIIYFSNSVFSFPLEYCCCCCLCVCLIACLAKIYEVYHLCNVYPWISLSFCFSCFLFLSLASYSRPCVCLD